LRRLALREEIAEALLGGFTADALRRADIALLIKRFPPFNEK